MKIKKKNKESTNSYVLIVSFIQDIRLHVTYEFHRYMKTWMCLFNFINECDKEKVCPPLRNNLEK